MEGGPAKSSHGENCVRIFDQPILLCYCACHKIPSFLQVLPNADDDEVVAVDGEHEEVNSKNEDFFTKNSCLSIHTFSNANSVSKTLLPLKGN